MLALITLAATLVQQLPTATGGWTVTNPTASYAVDTAGRPFTAAARVSLRPVAATPGSMAAAMVAVAADTFRVRRVVATAEARGHGTASIVLWASNSLGQNSGNATSAIAPADTQWTARRVELIVSRTARNVGVSVTARAGGDIEVRDLRLSVESLPSPTAPLGDDARRELDSAITIVRRMAYWRDTVTWPAVEADVRAFAAGTQTAADTYPAIRELLSRLGDHHSFLMPAQQATQWQAGTLVKNPLPTVKSMGDGIGYISVPAYSGGDPKSAQEYAAGAHKLLVETAPTATCGWILDLRRNGGGNMWPMLAGLKPFVGSVPLGSFSGPTTAPGAPWIAGTGMNLDIPASLAGLDSSTIAVLLGPGTASSGEAVAIAFHGRPRTRSFGLPTAGLANGNSGHRLPDGAMMQVMSVIDLDRNGQRFGEKVSPDEAISTPVAVAQIGTADDAAVSTATRWLRSQPGCR